MKTIREFINLVEENTLAPVTTTDTSSNPKDVIKIDVPLMIRLLEFAREDSKNDMDLHNLTEKLIELSKGDQVLTMSNYDSLVNTQANLMKSLEEQFDIIEELVEGLAREYKVDSEIIWQDFESVDDQTLLEVAAWQRKEGKNKTGGLNAKGVASYRREHPGSKLQTAVTTKPSKLKPGSKAAKRRKSFCARMGGMKGPMKDKHGKPTRKALALRKWNCHEAIGEDLRDPKDNPCWKGYKPVGTKKKSGKTVPNCVPKKHKP